MAIRNNVADTAGTSPSARGREKSTAGWKLAKAEPEKSTKRRTKRKKRAKTDVVAFQLHARKGTDGVTYTEEETRKLSKIRYTQDEARELRQVMAFGMTAAKSRNGRPYVRPLPKKDQIASGQLNTDTLTQAI